MNKYLYRKFLQYHSRVGRQCCVGGPFPIDLIKSQAGVFSRLGNWSEPGEDSSGETRWDTSGISSHWWHTGSGYLLTAFALFSPERAVILILVARGELGEDHQARAVTAVWSTPRLTASTRPPSEILSGKNWSTVVPRPRQPLRFLPHMNRSPARGALTSMTRCLSGVEMFSIN